MGATPVPFELRRELHTELRLARVCILVVTLLWVLTDQLMVHMTAGVDGWTVGFVTIIDGIALVVFVGLFFFAVWRPVMATGAALVAFWLIHLVAGILEPQTLSQGLLMKALDTIILVKAIKSARRSEQIAFSVVNQAATPAT
ncbi:MAG TPA: hypothetical protein VGM88_00605 [Kofleriaceae bacterium]|jgi:hypothetical protein